MRLGFDGSDSEIINSYCYGARLWNGKLGTFVFRLKLGKHFFELYSNDWRLGTRYFKSGIKQIVVKD